MAQGFWRQCCRLALKGSTAFANDWRWLFGVPLRQRLATVSASYFGGTAKMTTGIPIVDGLVAAFIAFLITWLVAFRVRFLRAAPRIYRELEDEVAQLKNEYAHCLSLEHVNYEEDQKKNVSGEIIERLCGIALVLRNTISRPIRYTVRSLNIDGAETGPYDNRGSIIPALSTSTFYSPKHPEPPEGMNKGRQIEFDFEIEYGPPDKPLRVMHRKATLHVYPECQATRFIIKSESDEPIRDRD